MTLDLLRAAEQAAYHRYWLARRTQYEERARWQWVKAKAALIAAGG